MKKTIIVFMFALISACAEIVDDSKGYPTVDRPNETDLALMNIVGVV